ncbi:DUF4921 family protein [Corynebacterium sp. H127]|uniref:DUF4921 family protein n=1 Tax=Corynebacterium sp. H127 TaxID=3133418 RepID=UPI0030ADC1B0
MSTPFLNRPTPLITMADGTLKQVNPLTGTEVWTVPGRGNRPLSTPATDPRELSEEDHRAACAFCSERLLQTPPEKARVVLEEGNWVTRPGLLPGQLASSTAEFRRVPNLFEIVSYDYWQENYGYEMDAETALRMHEYLADPEGREHVFNIVKTRLRAAGKSEAELEALTEEELVDRADSYFGGGHDLIIGRRHFIDGATHDSQLASSGTLSVAEHRAMIRFTTEAIADLYSRNRYAPYVAVFQNWLKPAGASFDHLHKQLVAIDERGVHAEAEISRLRANPNMYNEWAVDYANYHNLILAENDHAVAFAGFGHRYPTLEVYSKSATPEPWLQTTAEINAMSDLIHACHAATGANVPCNEEWHHKPIDLDIPMPWRVMIKWRVSNLAGFEGGTKIYLNTLSPQNIRDRVVPELFRLREENRIAPTVRIATEANVERNSLKYNPILRG